MSQTLNVPLKVVERMIAEAVATERARVEAEMQSLAEGVDGGFRAISQALDAATDLLGHHTAYLRDLMTVAVAEEVRSGRLHLTRTERRFRPRRHRPC